MGSREERRLNLKIGLGLLVLLMALALFAYRPATLVGVSGEVLATSLGNLGSGTCSEVADSQWDCVIVTDLSSGRSSHKLYVETRAWGCWDAWSNPKRTSGEFSGCITFFDML